MLKSTHRPAPVPAPPGPSSLPPGWTEHKAPTGHSYYYNADTKQSTYTRPAVRTESSITSTAQDFISLNDTPDDTRFGAPPSNLFPNAIAGGMGILNRANWHKERRKPQDRPKRRFKIAACAPWVLVETRLRRRFVHNAETGESLWKFPEDVMKAVLEWDVQRMKDGEQRDKGEVEAKHELDNAVAETQHRDAQDRPLVVKAVKPAESDHELASDEEYEVVEVTDDEDGDSDGPSKRPRIQNNPDDGPVEFNEDDIAWQLQAMEQEYDEHEVNHDDMDEEWAEDPVEQGLTEEDSKALFCDLLNDCNANPYRTWEQVIEDGRIIDDERYAVLPNMRSRKEAFSDWSRDKIQLLKEQREREERKDPKIPYITFLEKHASPKLYWPEFKRKYRKEAEMRDSRVMEKDREKLYRDYIKRVQLPESTLKSDLSNLLKAQPLSALNRSTSINALPSAVLTDLRYATVRPAVREPLLETYISTLPPAPEAGNDGAEAAAKKKDRERREKALADREKHVDEEKKRQKRELDHGRDRLRAREREIQRATNTNRDGLRGQLAGADLGDTTMDEE